MKVFGLQLNVWDFDAAIEFYCNALGFEIENESYLPEILHVKKDGFRIIFYKIDEVLLEENLPHFLIDLETNNIQKEVDKLKSIGIKFLSEEIQQHPIADYIEVLDPFKNVINIVQLR